MPDYETLLVTVDDGVAVVTLNRPEIGNAFNVKMTAEFDEAIWALDADESVRAIVVTGAGKAFCTGWDLSSGADAFGAAAHDEHNTELGVSDDDIAQRYALWRMRTPLIAAINGLAIGAGLTITLLHDIRVVAEDARLRFAFTRLNLVPDANSTWLLPRIVGVSNAMELMLTGRWFTGAEAAAMGLASKAVPADQVQTAAMEIARDIADNVAPVAAGVTKELVYRFLGEPDRLAAMALETKLTWWTGNQPDTMEGVMALMEKRKPKFTGSKHEPLPEGL